MNPAATFVLLAPLLSPSGPSRPAPAVHATHGAAWAVVDGGQLWLCWDPSPRCFERVELDEAEPEAADPFDDESIENPATLPDKPVDATQTLGRDAAWRLGFAGRRLWVALDGHYYRVEPGQRRAALVDQVPPRRLDAPRPHACGPQGQVPAFVGAALGWQPAPSCAPAVVVEQTCLGPAGPRLRQPVPIQLRVGIELTKAWGWSASQTSPSDLEGPGSVNASAGFSVLAVIELGFDLGRVTRAQPARALGLRSRPLRSIPAVPKGPLAEHELAALREVLCAEDPR